jgi:hypothetical protein
MASETAPATGLSRRNVLVGTAWATPVVLVGLAAPPAAASTVADAFASTAVTSVARSGDSDIVTVQLALPPGIQLTGVTVTAVWSRQNSNANVALSGNPVQFAPRSSASSTAYFQAQNVCDSSTTLELTFKKASRRNGSDFTLMITGSADGGATFQGKTLAGTFA